MSLLRSETPWIFECPTKISPDEFEKLVYSWLSKGTDKLSQFRTDHLRTVLGAGGEYKIDIAVEFTILKGARLLVLVECKHQKRPVEREDIMVLEAKLRDTKAHKGMIFSTSGFQKGALAYAQEYGIAAISIAGGELLYETLSMHPPPSGPPSWMKMDKFVGVWVSLVGPSIKIRSVDERHLGAVREWFAEAVREATIIKADQE